MPPDPKSREKSDSTIQFKKAKQNTFATQIQQYVEVASTVFLPPLDFRPKTEFDFLGHYTVESNILGTKLGVLLLNASKYC